MCAWPHATCRTFSLKRTGRGRKQMLGWSFGCRFSPNPQTYKVPVDVTAAEFVAPHDTCTTFTGDSASISFGLMTSSPLSWPSCPCSPPPHDSTLLRFVMKQVCRSPQLMAIGGPHPFSVSVPDPGPVSTPSRPTQARSRRRTGVEFDLFRVSLVEPGAQAQLAVLAAAPREDALVVGQRGRVVLPAGDRDDDHRHGHLGSTRHDARQRVCVWVSRAGGAVRECRRRPAAGACCAACRGSRAGPCARRPRCTRGRPRSAPPSGTRRRPPA